MSLMAAERDVPLDSLGWRGPMAHDSLEAAAVRPSGGPALTPTPTRGRRGGPPP
jgi:hypothetical protein